MKREHALAAPRLSSSPVPPIILKKAHPVYRRRFEDATEKREPSGSGWLLLGQRHSSLHREDRPANVGYQACVKKEPPSPPTSDEAYFSSRLALELSLPRDMLSAPSAGIALDEGNKNAGPAWYLPPREAKPDLPPLFSFGVFTSDILLY
ncbi:hypothetical protein MTO96_032827 [Rhipicephalus appendiculatus]